METFKILLTVQKTIARYTEILIRLQATNMQKPKQGCWIRRSLSNLVLLPRCGNLSEIQIVKYIFHTLYMHTWCAIFHTLCILTFQGKKCTHILPSPMLKEIQNLHHKILNCAVNLPHTLWHAEEMHTFLPPKKTDTQGQEHHTDYCE